MKKKKMKIKSEGGSFNANQFRQKNIEPHYQDDYPSYIDSLNVNGDYKEKKEARVSYNALKTVADQVAPIAAIILTRVNQVGLFTGRSKHNTNGIGFEVRLKDPSREPKEFEKLTIEAIEEFILNCGNGTDGKRDNFDTFLRKIARDSLTYDQVNFEITYDADDNIEAFYAVDPATIKPASDDYEPSDEILDNSSNITRNKDIDDALDRLQGKDIEDDAEDKFEYLQVVDGKVVTGFRAREMAFAIRNPSTDIDRQPFGTSEIENIVTQLTSFIETEDYNMRYFKQGGMSKGVLNIKQNAQSGMADRQGLESFKRQWRTQVTGEKGAWKIPVFSLPGELEFINLAQSGGEMVFEKWMNYLINICCAVYQIDPAEINFPNNGGAGGKGNSLFSGEDDKVNNSKSKGLYPLMQFIQNTINTYIVSKFSDKYVFTFNGLDNESEESKLAIDKQKVESIMTVNEVRAQRGLSPLEGGDIILNPYYLQNKAQGDANGPEDFDLDFDKSLKKDILTIEDIEF